MRLARGYGVAAHTGAANTCGLASPSGKGKRRPHDGSVPGRALQVKLTTQGLDAVGEPAKPRAAGDARAATSVVADLGDDLVDGCFHCLGETHGRDADDLDRERGAVGE